MPSDPSWDCSWAYPYEPKPKSKLKRVRPREARPPPRTMDAPRGACILGPALRRGTRGALGGSMDSIRRRVVWRRRARHGNSPRGRDKSRTVVGQLVRGAHRQPARSGHRVWRGAAGRHHGDGPARVGARRARRRPTLKGAMRSPGFPPRRTSSRSRTRKAHGSPSGTTTPSASSEQPGRCPRRLGRGPLRRGARPAGLDLGAPSPATETRPPARTSTSYLQDGARWRWVRSAYSGHLSAR